MTQLKNHGADPTLGRKLCSLGVSALHDLAGSLSLPSKHFIALVACDSTRFSVDEMSKAGAWLLDQGAAVIATWGPGCEKFHDIIDETDLEVRPAQAEDELVLTTWHDSESLAEALWFVINTISPVSRYEATCNTVLTIAVGNPEWQAEIERWLTSPALLTQAVVGDSEAKGAPNPRVQRTRAYASLRRSPLTRHPLGAAR